MYDTEKLIGIAKDHGLTHAHELDMKALVFMPEIKAMCNAERCEHYGKSWSCPPAVGSVEEIAKKVRDYSYGLLVQTVGKMDDVFDFDTMQNTALQHQKNFFSLIKDLRETYPEVLPMGAGTCSLCKKCTYPDEPCRYPDDMITAMEAYGLWVSKVCELSGMPYNYGELTVTYTSCFLLK